MRIEVIFQCSQIKTEEIVESEPKTVQGENWAYTRS